MYTSSAAKMNESHVNDIDLGIYNDDLTLDYVVLDELLNSRY